MQSWTVLDEEGNIVNPSTLTESAEQHPTECGWDSEAGYTFIANDFEPHFGIHKWTGTEWIDDLDAARERKWAAAKKLREQHRDGITQTPWGPLQVDPESRGNLAGASLAATLAKMSGQERSFTWTMYDNTEPTLTVDEMIALGMIAMQHVDACYAHARVLREQIFSSNIEQLKTLDIEGGWNVGTV